MLSEGLRQQFAKNWQIRGQGTLQWTRDSSIKTPQLSVPTRVCNLQTLVPTYNYSCLVQHSDQTTSCKLNTWKYIQTSKSKNVNGSEKFIKFLVRFYINM